MSHGPKSVVGSEYLECIWSEVETCRQQGRGVWDFLTECMAAAAEKVFHVGSAIRLPAAEEINVFARCHACRPHKWSRDDFPPSP
jgi:hypothetical protein